jgi:tRNA(Ile)-lysidine synthase
MKNKISLQFQKNIAELAAYPPKALALGVSGGSDSMALLMLAKEWSDQHGAKISVLTVDHHLREESRQEAEYVGLVCGQMGLEHEILDWDELLSPSDERSEDPRVLGVRYCRRPLDQVRGKQVVKSEGNIQSRARKARYELMTGWCHENNISTLLTAHHLDDQVENFIIRLSRGSGLFGLLDHSFGLYNKINILRPLFNIPKKELQSYLVENNIKWCEDPSNHNPKYQRSNVRKWLDQMPLELEPELFKARVLQSQRHLRCAADYIQRDLDRELQENTIFHEGYVEYRMTSDPLMGHMTLSHLLCAVSVQEDAPRGESVELLRKNLLEGLKKATLHGCVVSSLPGGEADAATWKNYKSLGCFVASAPDNDGISRTHIIIRKEVGRKKT